MPYQNTSTFQVYTLVNGTVKYTRGVVTNHDPRKFVFRQLPLLAHVFRVDDNNIGQLAIFPIEISACKMIAISYHETFETEI